MSSQFSTCTLTRTTTVAAGAFAPGHLGGLTQHIPFELVDDVLEETKTVQVRVRTLPSRVGIYFVLALGLFPSLGYRRVWDKLVAGLSGIDHCLPSEAALRQLRRRLGPEPVEALFDTLAVPLARPATPGVRYRRWRTVAFDGCSSLKAPDLPRIRALLGKVRHHWGMSGYPALRLTVLCETGTRGLLGAVFGPSENGETAQAAGLLPRLTPQMLLLADRAFDGDDFLRAVADTGSQFLVRLCAHRRPAVLAALPDGSYLTRFHGLRVRIIEADITLTTSSGQRITGRYRLATTLLDHRHDPAEDLIRLYHERWEIESAFYSLRHTLLTGRVLRSQDPRGLEQEVWALLTLYQVIRMAMAEAVESVPGTDPDRASFTVALQAARDQVIRADHVLPSPSSFATSGISIAVQSALLQPRRARTSARKVKCPTSRYPANPTSEHPLTSQNVTSLAVEIHTQPPSSAAHGRSGQRNQVLQHMRTSPHRSWHARELATALDFTHYDSFCVQLGRWTREGLLEKIANATYKLAPECLPPQASPTDGRP
ncbi:IS4 family transposase [Streptomyces sp. NBC_01800]|uniref:IS4 family transposase n=1 Tax=Streptomyces sp. NBC_01800 TaxID=2975945 RepID=UPI002DD93720|nr:IS4 family transposase [Streptomyces sp. NBC_01800]